MTDLSDEEVLIRAMETLAVVEESIVLVGGAAHRLFPLHPLADELPYEPLTTEDIDVVVDLEIAYDGSPTVQERLRRAGFEEEIAGATYSTHRYRFAGDGSLPYVQFLAPATGPDRTREGRSRRRLVFSGIVAERLRHVGLLLHRPWVANLSAPGGRVVSVRVANPVTFLVQKLLILGDRSRAKRGRDLVYLYDTLAMFADHLDRLAVEAELLPALSRKQRRAARANAERHCFEEGDTSREAAVIANEARSGGPTSGEIVSACRSGLRTILGPYLGVWGG